MEKAEGRGRAMTRAVWAERKVEGLEFIAFMNNGEVPVCESKDVVKALLAEHKRAVRVVQKSIESGTHHVY